ncbi:MAG: HAD-IA family hydrolase, partial [Bacteroidota bacterium]
GVPSFKILKDLNKEFSLHMDPWGVTEKKEDIFLELLDKVQPIQPVVGLVHAYHGKLPMAVGTGGIIKIATFLLETLNIDSFFEILVTSEDVTHYKPHPETFLKCAEHMGIAPEFCQVFEDGDPGIEAAKAGGMQVTDVREYV